MSPARSTLAWPFVALWVASGCASQIPESVAPTPWAAMPAKGVAAEDSAPKEDLRMMPPEAYMRMYLQLFGGLAPSEAQKRARGNDGSALFDTWDDYVSALGFPDYRLDVPRQTQTNALMVAAFERLGVALCDRALEHDVKGPSPPALKDRLIFVFDLPKGVIDANAFAPRFDELHRTFLGYPARLGPAQRARRFFQMYSETVAGHAKANPKSRLSPEEAGWAAVCYGLVRHPELHLY